MKKISLGLVFLLTFALNGIVATSASAFVGGMLQTDTTLTKSNSPYIITNTIEIPTGKTLTVEAGVEIYSENRIPLFFINGTVNILGSSTEPVKILTKGDVFYPKNASDAHITVHFTSIDAQNSGSLVAATGYGQNASYEIADSDFRNLASSYIWYPTGFLAERNTFSQSGGFSIGFDGRQYAAPIFRNNLFIGNALNGLDGPQWINAWASYGSTLHVNKNTFSGINNAVIKTTTSYDVMPLDATSNFWGTTDQTAINQMVLDSSDSLNYGTSINTTNFLVTPDSQTPTASRISFLTPTPIATPSPSASASSTPTPIPTVSPNVTPTPSASPLDSMAKAKLPVRARALNNIRYVQSKRVVSIQFFFMRSDGAPASNSEVRFASSGSGGLLNDSATTDSNGVAIARIMCMENGQASLTASNSLNTLLSAVNFEIGETQAGINLKSKTITVTSTFAAGKSISVYEDGKRKISTVTKLDDPWLYSWTAKKGSHIVNVRISGGISITKKFVVK